MPTPAARDPTPARSACISTPPASPGCACRNCEAAVSRNARPTICATSRAHFATGALDPTEWPLLDDEALIERLTDVKGIGRWTAEMFLIFHELRADVFPVDDIGIQNADRAPLQRRRAAPARRDARDRRAWQPWRSVASWYLWRSLDPIPVEY